MLPTSSRSFLGSSIWPLRFGREHPKGSESRKKYDLSKTRQEKQAFRESWAKTKYSKVFQEKQYEQGYIRVDKHKGSYKTLGGLVMAYGGWTWQPAIDGAMRDALNVFRTTLCLKRVSAIRHCCKDFPTIFASK